MENKTKMFWPFRLAMTKILVEHHIKNVTSLSDMWIDSNSWEWFDNVCQSKNPQNFDPAILLPWI